MTTKCELDNKKRRHSTENDTTYSLDDDDGKRRQIGQGTTSKTTTAATEAESDRDGDLLARLTQILTEIKTTPSTGEISADLLGQLRLLMLRIEELSADENNTEARQLKDESDKYLELWFDDLLAQCEADDEIEWDELAYQQQGDSVDGDEDDESDDEETIALALALQDEEEAVKNDSDEDQRHDKHTVSSTTGHTNYDHGFTTVEIDENLRHSDNGTGDNGDKHVVRDSSVTAEVHG